MGNGFVVEAVNDVLRVYHTDGTPATGVMDLNTFYGYPPAIVRTGPHAGQRGPSITDPSCIYDQVIGRFVLVVLTLDHVGLTASLTGNNHLDIAVSDSGRPDGHMDDLQAPGAEQRHRGHAESPMRQRVLPRRLSAHRRRRQRDLPHDQ